MASKRVDACKQAAGHVAADCGCLKNISQDVSSTTAELRTAIKDAASKTAAAAAANAEVSTANDDIKFMMAAMVAAIAVRDSANADAATKMAAAAAALAKVLAVIDNLDPMLAAQMAAAEKTQVSGTNLIGAANDIQLAYKQNLTAFLANPHIGP